MKTWQEFSVGDVVSRLGDDEQVIVGKNDLGDMLELRCIKSDHNGVFQVGDTECNCADAYEYIRSPNSVKNNAEFERPYAAKSYLQAVAIAVNECKKRAWIPADVEDMDPRP